VGCSVKTILVLCAVAALLHAVDVPLYVFDNGVGHGALSIEEQTEG